MAPEARLPCQGFELSECIHPCPLASAAVAGAKHRDSSSKTNQLYHGRENASLSHDTARRQQIQFQGPIHASPPALLDPIKRGIRK